MIPASGRVAVTARLLFVVASLLVGLAQIAHADFAAAVAAYERQDFAAAFGEFRELAELGHAASQENLAVMYVKGEGTKRDNVLGYAWARLALEQGGGEAADGIVTQLEPRLDDAARQRVTELTDRFGQAALQARILPAVSLAPSAPRCRMRRPVNPNDYYPKEVEPRGSPGSVIIEMTVMPDGRARNPRTIASIPPDIFDEAARRVGLDTLYVAAEENGVPVRCRFRFKVKFGRDDPSMAALKTKLEEMRKEALAGRSASQLLLARLLQLYPGLSPGENPVGWYLKAAQGGSPAAQFVVGYETCNGGDFARDEAKGRFWLEQAARHGNADAQVALANYLARPGETPAEHRRALELLELAVVSGAVDARYHLAAFLAAGPEADLREPRRALALLKGVVRDMNRNASGFEIRAAAHAMLGEFADAQKDQKKAIELANTLGWDLKPLRERLDRYAARQTWTGELMIY
jgi:TonB family protein